MISLLLFLCFFIFNPETAPQLIQPVATFFLSPLPFSWQVQVHVTPRDCRNKAHSVILWPKDWISNLGKREKLVSCRKNTEMYWFLRGISCPLPKTSSSSLKIGLPKRKVVSHPPVFRVYLSFREWNLFQKMVFIPVNWFFFAGQAGCCEIVQWCHDIFALHNLWYVSPFPTPARKRSL